VKIRRGPAAVTGDKGRLKATAWREPGGKARPEDDPGARRPAWSRRWRRPRL